MQFSHVHTVVVHVMFVDIHKLMRNVDQEITHGGEELVAESCKEEEKYTEQSNINHVKGKQDSEDTNTTSVQ